MASERRSSARPIAESVRHERLRSRRERLLYELDDAVHEGLAAHDDADGEADEVEVLELHARAFVAVVVENLDSRGLESLVEPVRRLEDVRVALEHGDDAGEWRERNRPDNAVLVVVLLHGRRDRTAEAEP